MGEYACRCTNTKFREVCGHRCGPGGFCSFCLAHCQWGDCDVAEPDHLRTGRERVADWVWCSEVWAVMTNDGCATDNRHESDCPCENRYPLTIAGARS